MKLAECRFRDDPTCCVLDDDGRIDCKFCDGTGRWTPTLTCELCGGRGRMPWPYEIDHAAQERMMVRRLEAIL
jgi:RecJ-like exonuclease